jgi:hypothetical protein
VAAKETAADARLKWLRGLILRREYSRVKQGRGDPTDFVGQVA